MKCLCTSPGMKVLRVAFPGASPPQNRTFCHNGCSYRSGYALTDFDDFGGGFGVAEFGEVVSSACEFQEEGSSAVDFSELNVMMITLHWRQMCGIKRHLSGVSASIRASRIVGGRLWRETGRVSLC